jgi:predicted enzyme related to lactoylglutathione lyase
MKLAKIGVLMLGVSDLTKSMAFYRDQLGLTLQQEIPNDFAFFIAGSITLALSIGHAKALGGAKPGATEIVFSVDDVTAAYDALRSRGVVFTREPRNVAGTMWAANFTDPDGHQLSVFGPKKQ